MKNLPPVLIATLLITVIAFSWLRSDVVYFSIVRLWYSRPGAPSADKLAGRIDLNSDSPETYLKSAYRLYKVFPDNRSVKLLYARSLIRAGRQPATAVSILYKMAEEDPTDFHAVRELVSVMYNGGYYPDIVGFFRDFKGTITDRKLQKIYGISLYMVKDYDAALKLLSSVVEKSSKDPEATYYIALCYEKKADLTIEKKDEFMRMAVFYMRISRSYEGFTERDFARIMKKGGKEEEILQLINDIKR